MKRFLSLTILFLALITTGASTRPALICHRELEVDQNTNAPNYVKGSTSDLFIIIRDMADKRDRGPLPSLCGSRTTEFRHSYTVLFYNLESIQMTEKGTLTVLKYKGDVKIETPRPQTTRAPESDTATLARLCPLAAKIYQRSIEYVFWEKQELPATTLPRDGILIDKEDPRLCFPRVPTAA